MANRRHLGILSGSVALLLLMSALAAPADARLPWAATSGLHFVEALVNADNYRAKAAGLAMKRSPSSDVRQFAHAVWVSSVANRRRLEWVLMRTEPYVVLPSQVSPRYMFVIDQLIPVSGEAFDERFIAQQTASLAEALALAQAYARVGDDLDLKDYAARSVPKIQAQLDRIREIGMRHEQSASR
jgi:putative membrane protein